MSELFSLKGRVALMTGASGGLGRQFALTLSRAGASRAGSTKKNQATTTRARDRIERRQSGTGGYGCDKCRQHP